MLIWTVENGELVEYERHGECNQCGECCCTKTIGYRCRANSQGKNEEGEEQVDYGDWEGWHSLYAQGLTWWFKITEVKDEPYECSRLQDGKCDVWKSDEFPAICRYWPFHPSNLEKFPNCSFTFERADVDGEGMTDAN